MNPIKSLWLLPAVLIHFAFSFEEIAISQEETAKNGIKVIPLNQAFNTKGVPFNALIDFDDKTSITQSSSFETIVVNIYKREGESVKEGDLICDISSNELSALFFELTNTQERLKIAAENERKDKALYKAGVISKREYPLHLSHNIQKGAPLFDDDGNKIGEIEALSVVIDKVSNTILATANIRDTNLKVGEMIEVYIDGLLPKGTILIPSSAVIKNGNDYLIFIQTAKGFKPTKIEKVEERDNSFVINPKGLNNQMKIATGNIISLKGMMDGLGRQ